MDSFRLVIAQWVVEHRSVVRAIGMSIVAFIALSVLLNGLVGLIVYASIDRNAAQALEASVRQSVLSVHGFTVNEPLPLTQEPVHVVNRTSTGSDVVGVLANPNTLWKAFVRVTVGSSDEDPSGMDVVLPGSKRYIIKHLSNNQTAASMTIVSTRWERIDRHTFPDPIETLKTTRAIMVAAPVVSSDAATTTVTFSITNATAYQWRELNWAALATLGDQLVGARSILIADVAAGSSRPVVAGWQQSFPQGTQFQLMLQSDVLSNDLIAHPTGDQQEL